MIFALDDGRSWRKDIYPEYKGKRQVTEKQRQMKADYLKQKPLIVAAVKLLGITHSIAGNMEADDLAYTLTKNAVAKNIPVTLYTADEDWQQLVQPNVNWIDLIRNKTCDYNTFKRDTGYSSTDQFIEAKCLLGDVGDNIIGPKGIGPAKAQIIYSWWPDMYEFLEELETKPEQTAEFWYKVTGKVLPKVFRELNIKETVATLKSNDILVNLSTTQRPPVESLCNTRKPLVPEDFRTFGAKVSINLRGSALDEFLQPFISNRNIITGNGQNTV